MRWERLGRVYAPGEDAPAWRRSHGAYPVACPGEGGRVRVLFAGRDARNRSSVASLELDPGDPGRPVGLAAAPLLGPGPRGAFDDAGVTPACLVELGGVPHLYYLGWTLGRDVPFRCAIGLARAEGDGFVRRGPAPVLGLSDLDPFSVSYPWVLPTGEGEAGGGGYRMWYGSHVAWAPEGAGNVHQLRHASSPDGVTWRVDEAPALVPDTASGEAGLARPCVRRGPGGFHMWYSIRGPGEGYRLGYATSPDGLAWTRRDDEVGLAPAGDGWDGRTLEYPCVFPHQGRWYLLYCGDGYGATGFGLARMVGDEATLGPAG